ncbi:putative ATP-dependent endonuclease of OLD family [Onishia taeanensis]|uniref:Putative ATP-dependent endonuclease of OLD family n=1 Tax=Onishia taeanensis TaxID=284577 RepID=A0A328XLS8_9GAMM|nr:AAA family ATPase [Halomonas taeanensis]RAR59797.1 putative ATP-dependent endonuclease of OLD family [Halomonas taeanensis]
MSVLIKTVRVRGFRGIENIEVELERTTVLTGMNNTGKTSLLRAIQLATGARASISQDDFYIKDSSTIEKITIDLLIAPVSDTDQQQDDFDEDWEIVFGTERIKTDGTRSYVPLRACVELDEASNSYQTTHSILPDWPSFHDESGYWYEKPKGKKTSFRLDELPFFYMDAQRDILEDTRLKSSYIGKMLSKVEYTEESIQEIEDQIAELNEKTVDNSEILKGLKSSLQELNSAMDGDSSGVELTPFTKKLRDLGKGMTIYYSDSQDSFSMEYHGMGTRSWSSLLTLKAFIQLLERNYQASSGVFLPILAIEEPEAHLHPNAQKKLFGQIHSIKGQKIISTHSPYVTASSSLSNIRSLYKDHTVHCGKINLKGLTDEDTRKIYRQVINTRGEMFFSKLLVFAEGETEEQALPIFFKKYFGYESIERGVDFVSVSSHTAYLPFLRFSEGMNIPWMIFSDAEADAKQSVQKALKKIGKEGDIGQHVVFVEDGNDFEKEILAGGYEAEVRKAIASFDFYHSEQHREAREATRLEEIEGYSSQELYEKMTSEKTRYGPAVAYQIVDSEKQLPEKVVELMEMIERTLQQGH